MITFQSLTSKKAIVAYTSWWAFWVFIHLYVLLGFNIAFKVAVIDSLLTNFTIYFLVLSFFYLLKYYQPQRENIFYMRIWTLLLAVFVTLFLNWLFKKIFYSNTQYLQFISQSFTIRFCYHFLMISFISLVIWVWNYLKEIQEGDTRKTQAEQLAKEAELNNIRQQLQPHFLFNSLNSISALAGSRPEEARKMIQQLSDFLRGTMRKDEQQLIKLEDELTHLKLYLDIEKVRFGHRLKNEILCDEESLSMLLPALILQPVVENAIKFGLYDTTDNITISVSSTVEENQLIIIVKNPFDPQTSSPKQGVGFGLNSINRRLYLLFARQDLLQTHSEKNQFITTIKIPQV